MDVGKIPPQARDLEEIILGSCMLEREAISKTMALVTAESFYVPSNQIIFEAITTLYSQGNPVDLMTVTEQLRKVGKLDDAGGAFVISDLTSRITSTAHIESHCLIVAQKWILREIIRIGTEAVREGFEDTTDVFKLLDNLTIQLIQVTAQITKHTSKHIAISAKENLIKIEKIIG